MAFTTVPTYVTNQLITASHANTYWRDNLNALFPYTAIGDIAYASALDTITRLGIGTAGQVLQVNSAGNAPEWGTGGGLSCFALYTGASESVGSSWAQSFSFNITVPVTSKIIVISSVRSAPSGFSGTVQCVYKWNIDGTDSQTQQNYVSSTAPGMKLLTILGYKGSVSPGTIACQLWASVEGGVDSLIIINAITMALGFAES